MPLYASATQAASRQLQVMGSQGVFYAATSNTTGSGVVLAAPTRVLPDKLSAPDYLNAATPAAGMADAGTRMVNYILTVLADAPTAYYRLNETQGTTVNDGSGHGYTGSVLGGVTLGVPGAVPNGDTGYRFDGSTGQLVFNTLPTLTSFTFETWVNWSSAIWGTLLSTANMEFAIDGSAADGIVLLRLNGNATPILNNYLVPTLTWCHVVVTCGGGEAVAYVNGAVVGSVAATATGVGAPFYAAHSVFNSGGADWLGGMLSELVIYDYALSAARVQAHYLAALQ